MRKILVPILLVVLLGACSKPSESHVEAPINSASPSVTLNPEDSQQLPQTVEALKFGQSFTYLDGVS